METFVAPSMQDDPDPLDPRTFDEIESLKNNNVIGEKMGFQLLKYGRKELHKLCMTLY